MIAVSATEKPSSTEQSVRDFNYGNFITVAAPGKSFTSTDYTEDGNGNITWGYTDALSGTSFAAPHVDALVGLLLSVNPYLTISEITNILESTADKIDTYQYTNGKNDYLGYGRINAGKALQSIAPPGTPQNLSSSVVDSHPRLAWDANPEYDIAHYDIYRDLGSGFSKISSVNAPQTYYDDNELYVSTRNNNYQAYYYIKAVDQTSLESPESAHLLVHYYGLQKGRQGDSSSIEISTSSHLIPRDNSISQNYPNPFNPKTMISYSIAKSCQVELRVYDVLGKQLRVLVDRVQEPGYYDIPFDASELPSGIYFCKFRAGEYSSTKQMILQK